MFIGFESSANLAEETSNPRKHLPLAIFGSSIAVGVFYVIVTYSQAVGFGLDVNAWLEAFPPLYALSADPTYGGSTFGELVQWLVVIDIAAVGLGTATGSSRGVFALARDGRLPSFLAKVHPRYKTPYVASTVLAVASVILMRASLNAPARVASSARTAWSGSASAAAKPSIRGASSVCIDRPSMQRVWTLSATAAGSVG